MSGPRIFLPALQALTQVLYNYISLPTTQDLTQELSAMYAHNRTWHHQTHPYGSDVWGRQCILAFTDWEQTVCVNGIYSSSSTLMHGAPQGSAWIISLHSLWYFYVSHYPSSFFVMKACRYHSASPVSLYHWVRPADLKYKYWLHRPQGMNTSQ